MELNEENYPDAFCDECGELLPEPEREEIGEGIYELVRECTGCGEIYRSGL